MLLIGISYNFVISLTLRLGQVGFKPEIYCTNTATIFFIFFANKIRC